MVLSVRSLTVRKGRHTLLENVSFNVEPGRVLGLYGPSGAGKSITLLTICGLQDHAFTVAGQIWYAGREVSNLPTERRSMLLEFRSCYRASGCFPTKRSWRMSPIP